MYQFFTSIDLSQKTVLLQTKLFENFLPDEPVSSQPIVKRTLETTIMSIAKLMKTCDKLFLAVEYLDTEPQEIVSILEQAAQPPIKQVMYVDHKELEEKNIPAGTLVLLESFSRFKTAAKKFSSFFDIVIIDSLEMLYSEEVTFQKLFPSATIALGPAAQNEKDELEKILYHSEHPAVFIAGGNDVNTTLQLSQPLLKSTDQFLFAGKISYTFLYSRLISVGNSIVEKNFLSPCFQLIDKISYLNKEFVLPIDHVVTEKIDTEKMKTKTQKKEITKGFTGIDIGAKTITAFKEKIKKANTIIWHGTLSSLSQAQMQTLKSNSNTEIIKAIAKSHAYKVIVGQEAIVIAQEENVLDKFNLILVDEKILTRFLPQNFSVTETG